MVVLRWRVAVYSFSLPPVSLQFSQDLMQRQGRQLGQRPVVNPTFLLALHALNFWVVYTKRAGSWRSALPATRVWGNRGQWLKAVVFFRWTVKKALDGACFAGIGIKMIWTPRGTHRGSPVIPRSPLRGHLMLWA